MSLPRHLNGAQREDSPLLPSNNRGRDEGPHGWRDILENKMTWAWYTTIMSSGGVALIIFNLPYAVKPLWIVGGIVYMASLIGFLLLLLIHLTRFALNPRVLPASITHQSEGLFVSTFAAAMGILIIDGATYSEKMHTTHGMALRAFYWIFVGVAVLFGVATPLVQFSRTRVARIDDEAPAARDYSPMAIQQILPLTLVGYAASTVVSHIDPISGHHLAMPILYTATAVQGMGALLGLIYLAGFVDSLYRNALPSIANRPSMFVSVGPPAFTALSFALMAEQSLKHFPANPSTPGETFEVVGGVALYYIGMVMALMFWGLAAWFFCVSVLGNIVALGEMDIGVQQLQMFALIFPNVGFALASTHLARLLGYPKILAVGAEVLDLVVIVSWAIVAIAMVFGVVSGRIFRGPI
ncbi:uncharacterized protein H6S33_004106 [Morchella sextelata]|uniref:uncharacterized protein n=1 Tax=Morchella sextelata TaxID=1174677 RepID=UPI001D044652|nr:uncharacterized protein H6S33_004106 [Morchella sextelata]KAH0606445.1 hypothetical protein H6S33_004106 [Morchella sextelata]